MFSCHLENVIGKFLSDWTAVCTISHGEAISIRFITSNVVPNLSTAMEECGATWEWSLYPIV